MSIVFIWKRKTLYGWAVYAPKIAIFFAEIFVNGIFRLQESKTDKTIFKVWKFCSRANDRKSRFRKRWWGNIEQIAKSGFFNRFQLHACRQFKKTENTYVWTGNVFFLIIKDSSLSAVRTFIIYYMQSTCWTHGKSCKFYCNANNASPGCNLSLLNVLNFISRVVKLEDVLWCSKCFFETTVFLLPFVCFRKERLLFTGAPAQDTTRLRRSSLLLTK